MPAAPSAKAKNAPVESAGTISRTARRRVPTWLIALVCAAVAVAYGVVFERLKMSPGLVMLGLGGMTVALCGSALWRMIDPLTRPDEPAAMLAPRAPQRLRELEREKQAVLKAIKEIELDYQMRKIAEGDYRDMIERYRGRAMRLISELEAGDNYRELIERELRHRLSVVSDVAPPTAPVAAAVTTSSANCPACATVNDNDAQFCKSCGVRLAKS